jgi:hypothetical protein
MKSKMDWSEIDYLLKFRYPMGHPHVEKKSAPYPFYFKSGMGGTHPYPYLNCHP